LIFRNCWKSQVILGCLRSELLGRPVALADGLAHHLLPARVDREVQDPPQGRTLYLDLIDVMFLGVEDA
jgi:hypothetical protein